MMNPEGFTGAGSGRGGPDIGFAVGDFFGVLRRHWRLLSVVWCTVVVGAILLYFITPRQYRATTTLQIEPQDTGTIAVEDLLGFSNASVEYYQTQYRLLQSRGLAERVVERLNLADNAFFNPPRSPLLAWLRDPLDEMDDAVVLGELASDLLGDLDVSPIRRTHLVEVSYTAPTPELAARVANGVADAFIDWGIEKRFRTVGQASSFLSAQIEALKQEIADREAQLQAYSRRTDIVALDPQSNVTLQSLEALNRDYIAAVSQRIQSESTYRELTSTSKDSIADTLSGGLVAELRAEQAKLEREYANKLATYKPDWPMMQELKAQIDKGRQNLELVIEETVSKARETARTEYQTALRREQSLSAELNRKKSEAMELNSAAVEYNNLKVEVSTRRGLLDELLRSQSETMVASRLENSRESNIVVVDAALRPLRAHRPLLPLNLGIGIFFGFFLGIVTAFVVEYLDRTIKAPEEIEQLLRVPVLGAIPDTTARYAGYGYTYESAGEAAGEDGKADSRRGPVQVEQIPRIRPRHGVSEAYRSLRTALLLSSAEGLKIVAITSAGPEEGKTATAANLAIVMAQLGRNVLLVDADLRKPRVHQIFRVANRSGLVSYLTGGSDLDSIILSTDIPRLYITPAGPHPPNPSELLSSMRMQTFASLVRKREFDIVLIDCPPVLPVTDATLLGAMSDGMVLCYRAGVVLREDAIMSTERLRLAQVKILGAVLNAYRPQARLGKGYQPYAEYLPVKKKGTTRSVA